MATRPRRGRVPSEAAGACLRPAHGVPHCPLRGGGGHGRAAGGGGRLAGGPAGQARRRLASHRPPP
eukprot:4564448-Pyramimonas_sp.AAC.1